ncbi:MAG: hypothetical protein U0361_23015 [Nitrospiraceae bacterium]
MMDISVEEAMKLIVSGGLYTPSIRVDAIGRKVVARRWPQQGIADRLVCTRRSLLSCRPL